MMVGVYVMMGNYHSDADPSGYNNYHNTGVHNTDDENNDFDDGGCDGDGG